MVRHSLALKVKRQGRGTSKTSEKMTHISFQRL